MMVTTKRKGSLLLIGVLVSIILLAGSLSSLQLQSGRMYLIEGNEDSESSFYSNLVSPILSSSTFVQGVIGLAFISIIVLFLIRLIMHMNISQMTIKENLGYIAALALTLGAIYILSRMNPPPQANDLSKTFSELPPTATDFLPYQIGEMPGTVIWLTAGIIVVGVSLVMVFGITGWVRPNLVSDQLLQEAEHAVQNLKSGKELSDVIIQYYAQMSQILQEQRGIERNHTMTVREFEYWLEYEGVPSAPVRQLTSLFEAVRYGKCQLGKEDQKNALHSLNEIIRYCRGGQ